MTDEDLSRRFDFIAELVSSVAAHIDRRFNALERRFDDQATRLDRQGALLQTGSRWTNRMNQWAEKIDASMEAKNREISELRKRLDRLEAGE